ncbi:ABC-type phosphate/phosphonate transport system substrate-binding protein [Geothermobacter ehrlichii]|uniref:ABC-type phosphate/phosphonate transport system substrate-binding protein n=1 Tax=Geothermobacter ehrlichii TaxID=213224 RepID=A0A5D3WLQ2_9BACT|nr:PhnD/SsuA/transferrin family substrate-binding protein [Geothermobacter ehrlichii]TYO98469.1 ABC-type phosphate/phosphonate transport system substrate-binding protein [Geothermobacter ehrlichii]
MKKLISAVTLVLLISGFCGSAFAIDSLTCWFPPGWKNKADKARTIAKALSEETGIKIRPRIAKSYPEILKAFSTNQPNLVYAGSFVQAIIKARGLGTPLVQNINGKDLYCGVLVYPKGEDPVAILANYPDKIAYAIGASSGESSAKAATNGKAAIGVANHSVTCAAVKAGKAKAGVVKNWWWEANRHKFPELAMYKLPGISINKNPDNVLTASNAVPVEIQKKIAAAAQARKEAFDAPKMVPFDVSRLDFPLKLMAKGKIDPMTYSW